MKQSHKFAHMEAALIYAKLSYCNRRKVGCVIVKGNRIISIGYNGTPPGAENRCEDEHGVTLPDVIHAEDNALNKLEEAGEDCEGATLFVTRSPCMRCAKRIIKAKIAEVYYSEARRNLEGVHYLRANNIVVELLT